jgi:hypothetical protein
MTVVSDRPSGDDDTRATMELNLHQLIDPADDKVPIVHTRAPQSDSFSGDLIVDNLAGLLNAAIADPTGVFGDAVRAKQWRLARVARTPGVPGQATIDPRS